MRLALLFFLSIILLQGLDFQPCYQKNSKAMFKINGIPAIGISKNRAILITDKRPKLPKKYKFLRGNKFLNMVLIESKEDIDYVNLTPTDKFLKADEVAVITKSGYEIGDVKKRQIAFSFAKFSKDTPRGSVVGIKCYSVVGIGVGNNEFIETRYVKFFLETDPFMYGDIGVRFNQESEEPIIFLTDPYRKGIKLKTDDIILEINGKKINDALELQDIIMFSKPNTYVDIKYIRNNKQYTKKILVYKMLGDSFDNETFLERFGLVFDENLVIIKVKPNTIASKKLLKVGDILRQVEDIEVNTPAQTARLLSQIKTIDGMFIFERDKFQFIIELKEEKKKK
jgi:hypothetical protein